MVDKYSALLDLRYPQQEVIPVLDSNHSTICKFDLRTPNYELVVSGIVDLVDWALKEVLTPNVSSSLSPPLLAASVIDNDDSSSNLGTPHRITQLSYAYLPDLAIPAFQVLRGSNTKFHLLVRSICGRTSMSNSLMVGRDSWIRFRKLYC